ncbi:hypothetical protein SOVF_207480, partial [Spinacia oleracea]
MIQGNYRTMDFLELRKQQLLYNFEEFEREFLPPYDDSESVTKLNSGKNMSWIEEMEQEFVSNQLNVRKIQASGSNTLIWKQLEMLSDQIHETEENKNMKPSNEENIVYIELSDTTTTTESSYFSLENLNMDIESPTQIHNIAYPPTPSLTLLEELGYELTKEMNYTNDPLIIGSSCSDILVPPHAENMNTYDLINLDEHHLPPLDPSFLEFIDFEIPASLQMEIDNTAHINKATADYFTKKVDGNLRVPKGVCCGGKCWRYVESKLSSMQSIPRGRKRKGFEPTPDQISLKKHRQKIRNRESAAAAYKKVK